MRRKNVVSAPTGDPRLARLDQELIRREAKELSGSFRKFCEAAWQIIEPGTPFLDGLPVDVICQHLEACADGRIKKLLVNIPPRHSKSSLISVLYPAWLWTRKPSTKVLSASYSASLAIRDSAQSRRLIESDWYRDRWPGVVLSDDQNLKSSYRNSAAGHRQTTSVGGTTTGLGGDVIILDDPHNVVDAESTAIRETAVTWFREAYYNRTNNKDVCRIVIMQRVHHKDVSNYCIEQGGWTHLCLPMEYEGTKLPPTPLGWVDPRTEIGQVLWPERFSADEVADLKSMGEYVFAGQYQQRPTPRGGGMFKLSWLHFWYDPNLAAPDPVTVQDDKGAWHDLDQSPLKYDPNTKLQSWDLAFKGTDRSDFVCGQVWAKGAADYYLLDQEHGRYDFPATKAAIVRLSERHPTATILVEEKANGAAVIADLKGSLSGLIAVLPEGGKESRAAAVSSLFEAGNVYLPHPDQFPWVKGYIAELTTFPRGAHDDQVDATTQALTRLRVRLAELIDVFGSGGAQDSRGMDTRDSPFFLQ